MMSRVFTLIRKVCYHEQSFVQKKIKVLNMTVFLSRVKLHYISAVLDIH
jgi:hypothetical protein